MAPSVGGIASPGGSNEDSPLSGRISKKEAKKQVAAVLGERGRNLSTPIELTSNDTAGAFSGHKIQTVFANDLTDPVNQENCKEYIEAFKDKILISRRRISDGVLHANVPEDFAKNNHRS